MSETLELEAEIGRLFVEIESAKAFVTQATPQLNQLIKKLQELKKAE